MSKSKKFVFTTNNYQEFPLLKDDMQYLTYGKEVGESGTPHLQGFVFYKNAYRLGKVIKDFVGSHVEIAKTLGEAIQYCHKDGDFVELGIRPKTQVQKGSDEKERWELALTAAKEGRLDDIPSDIRFKHYRTCKEIAKDHMVKPDDATELTGVWYVGEAGTGKSRNARIDFPGAYLKMCNKWWDGYQNEEYVIIDDVDKKHDVLGHHLKIWADRYAFLAENKGGAVCIRPKKICVTSQYRIEDIWDDEETRSALLRRFKVVRFGNGPIDRAW